MSFRSGFSGTGYGLTGGVVSAADPLAMFPSWGTIQATTLWSDFVNLTRLAPFITTVTGTAAAISDGTPIAGRMGVVNLATGTDTTGSASVSTLGDVIVLGSGAVRFRADIVLGTASDGTDTYTAWFGLGDTGASAPSDGVDGVFFRYTHSVNSGKWVAVTRSNSVETTTNTTVSAISASPQTLELEVNAAASSVTFYVNGTSVATNAAHIPTGTARATGVMCGILKSAGTNSRSFDIDILAARFAPTTPL